jgi:hypothetical protein
MGRGGPLLGFNALAPFRALPLTVHTGPAILVAVPSVRWG